MGALEGIDSHVFSVAPVRTVSLTDVHDDDIGPQALVFVNRCLNRSPFRANAGNATVVEVAARHGLGVHEHRCVPGDFCQGVRYFTQPGQVGASAVKKSYGRCGREYKIGFNRFGYGLKKIGSGGRNGPFRTTGCGLAELSTPLDGLNPPQLTADVAFVFKM